jgi:hypothetical protein
VPPSGQPPRRARAGGPVPPGPSAPARGSQGEFIAPTPSKVGPSRDVTARTGTRLSSAQNHGGEYGSQHCPGPALEKAEAAGWSAGQRHRPTPLPCSPTCSPSAHPQQASLARTYPASRRPGSLAACAGRPPPSSAWSRMAERKASACRASSSRCAASACSAWSCNLSADRRSWASWSRRACGRPRRPSADGGACAVAPAAERMSSPVLHWDSRHGPAARSP